MYIGRIVAAGITKNGAPAALYRVSSRSFPNRSAIIRNNAVAVVPRAGAEGDLAKNPYIAYNCVRISGSIALVTNGSHTDPIIEKIASGMNVRDAFTLSLLALDFEHDSLDTPRIAAAVDASDNTITLGIVRRDAVLVRAFKCAPGTAQYVATYEKNRPADENVDTAFDFATAEEGCKHVISGGVFADFEKPVTAAAAIWNGKSFDVASLDA